MTVSKGNKKTTSTLPKTNVMDQGAQKLTLRFGKMRFFSVKHTTFNIHCKINKHEHEQN